MKAIKEIFTGVSIRVLSSYIVTIGGISFVLDWIIGIGFWTWIMIIVGSIFLFVVYKLVAQYLESKVVNPIILTVYDKRELKRIKYEGLLWKVVYPKETGISRNKYIVPSKVDIESDPLCPKCQTELNENNKIIGFKFNCPKCTFSKRKLENKYAMKGNAIKIAEREIELVIEKARNKE